MNQPNDNARVDRQDVQCQQFEQHLNECLDGRGSMSTLSSDPHLDGCDDCRLSVDIYRQFDRAGGALLNGGAPLSLNRKKRSPISHQRWLSLASTAVAAALVVFVVIQTPNGASNDQQATIDTSSSLITEASSGTGAERLVSAKDASLNLWDINYVTEIRSAGSAVSHIRHQPILDPLYEVGSISQRLLSSSLVSPIASDRNRGWEKPWRYTSELPGIRPFHRSVNVALVLYNDSMTVL